METRIMMEIKFSPRQEQRLLTILLQKYFGIDLQGFYEWRRIQYGIKKDIIPERSQLIQFLKVSKNGSEPEEYWCALKSGFGMYVPKEDFVYNKRDIEFFLEYMEECQLLQMEQDFEEACLNQNSL